MSEAFSPVALHFFKIILEKTLREKKLLIPKKFVRLYGKSLSNWVCVKLPCGSEWKMELLEYEGRVWLGKGWERFVEHYSIVRGHMICFKYQGNSRFEAVIFDTSTVEIDYPCKIRNCEEGPIEISDDFIAHPKSREKPQSPCSGDGKRKRTSPVEEHKINPCSSKPKRPHRNSERKGGSCNFDFEMEGKQDLPSTNDFGSVNYLDRYIHSAAFQKAYCFTSDRPCFTVVMQPHHMYNYSMHIPQTFAEKYIVNKSEKVFLNVRTTKKKTWSMMQYLRPNGTQVRAVLRRGWIYFVKENDLKIGDVCVFFLLKGQIKVTYEVVIFCVKENSEPPNSSGSTQADQCEKPIKTEPGVDIEECVDIEKKTPCNKDRLRKRAHLVSTKPVFEIIIQPSYAGAHSFMPIPRDIVQKYFKKEGNIILRVPNRGSWSMQFNVWRSIKTGQRIGKFFGGWKAFAKENSLRAGDVCIFQLIDGKKTSFEVSIIRFSKDPYYQQFKEENDSESDDIIKNETSTNCSGGKSPILIKEATTRKKALTSSEKTRFLERAYFKSKNPFCKVVVQPSYTSNGTHMPLPYDFARKYIKEDKVGFLHVQNSTRSWPVQFKFKRLKSNRLSAYISAGWKDFAESNNLRVSDVCIFKLTNKIDTTFNVSIVRAGIDDELQRHSQEGDSSKCSYKILRRNKRVKIEVD